MDRTELLALASGTKNILESIDEGENNTPQWKENMRLAEKAIEHFTEYFPVTSLHRNDLTEHGFPDAAPTDEQMEELARKLGDHFVEYGGYWETIETFCEDELHLIKGEESDDETEEESDDEN